MTSGGCGAPPMAPSSRSRQARPWPLRPSTGRRHPDLVIVVMVNCRKAGGQRATVRVSRRIGESVRVIRRSPLCPRRPTAAVGEPRVRVRMAAAFGWPGGEVIVAATRTSAREVLRWVASAVQPLVRHVGRGQSIGRPKALDAAKAALAQRMHAAGESSSTIVHDARGKQGNCLPGAGRPNERLAPRTV